MKVHCERNIFERFPTATIHGVLFDRLDLFKEQAAELCRAKAIENIQRRNISSESLTDDPAIREWREVYQQFGLKPSKYRSSIEQLYRRAMKGNVIQTTIPPVDLYCYISIIQMISMGAYDLQKVCGDITIRYTNEGEEFTPIGASTPLRSPAGVVAYTDDMGIICWAWNHRDSARTCLAQSTRTAIFFADSVTNASRTRAGDAIGLLSETLSSVGGIEIKRFLLDRENDEELIL